MKRTVTENPCFPFLVTIWRVSILTSIFASDADMILIIYQKTQSSSVETAKFWILESTVPCHGYAERITQEQASDFWDKKTQLVDLWRECSTLKCGETLWLLNKRYVQCILKFTVKGLFSCINISQSFAFKTMCLTLSQIFQCQNQWYCFQM